MLGAAGFVHVYLPRFSPMAADIERRGAAEREAAERAAADRRLAAIRTQAAEKAAAQAATLGAPAGTRGSTWSNMARVRDAKSATGGSGVGEEKE